MRILNILGGARDGGAEKFFERICFALSKKHNVSQEVIIRKNQVRYQSLKKVINKIHQINFFYFFNPFCHKKIEEIYSKFKPHITLTWMNRASRLLPTKNSKSSINIGRIGGYYKIKNYVNCDYIITNTEDLRNFVIEKGWDPLKVEFIPNFVDENNKEKIKKKSLKKNIICLGRFHKNKGIDILLKAMTYISSHDLWVVGGGEEKKFYDELISKYNLSDKVFFYEWTDNISKFLNVSDVLVCPSRHEPFGNVIVEAWAHKVPVIVSDIGGPKVIIKHKVNGLKFKNEDMYDFLVQFKTLDESKSTRQKLIKNGFNDYKKIFGKHYY